MIEILAKQGDISQMSADAIINAANSRMVPGGGVDGAINAAAGPELAKAMAKHGLLDVGMAAVTPAFKLNAKYVIHIVGPIYNNYTKAESEELLHIAYTEGFKLADAKACHSVCTPLVSTGVYGFPMKPAIEIAVHVARKMHTLTNLKTITFVAFDDYAFKLLRAEIKRSKILNL